MTSSALRVGLEANERPWHDRNSSGITYQETVYERPVYPGTLTCYETIPTIKSVRTGVYRRSARGLLEDTGLTNSGYMKFS